MPSQRCVIRLRSGMFGHRVKYLNSLTCSSSQFQTVCVACYCTLGQGHWNQGMLLPWGSVICLQQCLGGWYVSKYININARARGFPGEQCFVKTWSMLATVSGCNAVTDQCNAGTNEGLVMNSHGPQEIIKLERWDLSDGWGNSTQARQKENCGWY